MTGTRLKLVCGKRELNLSDGTNYAVGEGWHPPMTGVSSQLGGNVRQVDGQVITGRQAADRRISIPIILIADSASGKANLARKINKFIADNLKEPEKLYLHMSGAAHIDREPLYGQFGADLRLWVKDGGFSISPAYGSGQRVSNVLDNNILDLLVSPIGYGKRQELASGVGGLAIARYGISDPYSRGLWIGEATTNKMTNPIFGHSTWNSGWTAGASLVTEANTDKEFVYFGTTSAKIANDGTSTDTQFRQFINVGNTNTHILSAVIKPVDHDITPTAAYYQLTYNNVDQTTTWKELGNGWWVGYSARFSGVAANANVGLKVRSGRACYLGFIQLEEKNYFTPPCYGDMLDCTWSSTEHGSSSSRAAGRHRLDGSIANFTEGTLRVVWRAGNSNNYYSYNPVMFYASGGMRVYYDATNVQWIMNDGTNSISSATTETFTLGDVIVLHAVYSASGLKLYKNGVEIATGATYTAVDFGTYIYLGTSNAAALHANGMFQGFTVYEHAMSATEVAEDYTQIEPLADNADRVDYMPVLWTDDGDGNLDSIYSASDENYAVILDVPGDEKAQTEIYATQTTAVGTDRNLFLANLDTYEYLHFGRNLFFDQSSKVTSVDAATYDAITNTETLDYRWAEEFNNRQWYAFVYFTDAGSENLLAYQVIDYYQSTDQSINDSTLWPHTAPLSHYRRYTNAFFPNRDIYFYVMAKRTSGSAANVTTSYFMLVPSPLIYIGINPTANNASFWYQSEGGYVDVELAGSPTSYQTVRARGDTLEFVPDRYNTLIYAPTSRGVIYLAVNSIYVTPRWGLV